MNRYNFFTFVDFRATPDISSNFRFSSCFRPTSSQGSMILLPPVVTYLSVQCNHCYEPQFLRLCHFFAQSEAVKPSTSWPSPRRIVFPPCWNPSAVPLASSLLFFPLQCFTLVVTKVAFPLQRGQSVLWSVCHPCHVTPTSKNRFVPFILSFLLWQAARITYASYSLLQLSSIPLHSSIPSVRCRHRFPPAPPTSSHHVIHQFCWTFQIIYLLPVSPVRLSHMDPQAFQQFQSSYSHRQRTSNKEERLTSIFSLFRFLIQTTYIFAVSELFRH